MNSAEEWNPDEVMYNGVYEQLPDHPVRRLGDSDQADWELRFISTLSAALTRRQQGAGIYEIDRLGWSPGTFTLVVRVWRHDESGLVGSREHLPTLRRQFAPDDASIVAGAWHTGNFIPCRLPSAPAPDPTGIHWVR